MNKETFIIMVDELKTFFREFYPKYEELGMMAEDSPLLQCLDKILEATHNAVDPRNIGENLLTHDTPLLFDYIFEDKPSNIKTSGELYDYIKDLYEKNAKEIESIPPWGKRFD